MSDKLTKGQIFVLLSVSLTIITIIFQVSAKSPLHYYGFIIIQYLLILAKFAILGLMFYFLRDQLKYELHFKLYLGAVVSGLLYSLIFGIVLLSQPSDQSHTISGGTMLFIVIWIVYILHVLAILKTIFSDSEIIIKGIIIISIIGQLMYYLSPYDGIVTSGTSIEFPLWYFLYALDFSHFFVHHPLYFIFGILGLVANYFLIEKFTNSKSEIEYKQIMD